MEDDASGGVRGPTNRLFRSVPLCSSLFHSMLHDSPLSVPLVMSIAGGHARIRPLLLVNNDVTVHSVSLSLDTSDVTVNITRCSSH